MVVLGAKLALKRASDANLQNLRVRFQAVRGSLPALEALNEELRGLTSDAAIDLQCDVMAAVRALRAGKAPVAPASHAARPSPQSSSGPDRVNLISDILRDAEIEAPDGRPLFRYSVSDERYVQLRERIQNLHRQGLLEQHSHQSAATFVLYASEWFRRDYDGGGYSWESPAPEIIHTLSAEARKSLARDGLAYWGRTPHRTQHGEYRLLSLVLEGGFPTRLLESRERGKIATHLRTLLTRLETFGEAPEDQAIELSRSLGSGLGSYDHAEFHILCAELTTTLLTLKHEAHANAPAGVAASDWLDGARPSWRGDLPIRLVGDGAKRLLDDLLSGRAEPLGGGDARCWRLLVLRGPTWTPCIQLGMDGELRLSRTAVDPNEGRLRVHAAGRLASVLAGELGLLEPPTEVGEGWLCRPRGGRRHRATFPFDSRAEVELRTGEHGKTLIVWPQGEPLRSELLIFADDRGDDALSPPAELIHIGGGSLRTRRRRVYLLAPNNFQVTPLEGGAPIAPIWRGWRTLYQVVQPVHAGTAQDRYRIEVGADGERVEQLSLEGPQLRGAQAEDDNLPIYAGRPNLRTKTGNRFEALRAGQVQWRALIGAQIPHDWYVQPPNGGVGPVEVVWRDPQSKALRDRQRIVIVPEGARIKSRSSADRKVKYELENLDGWNLAVSSDTDIAGEAVTGGLQITFNKRPTRRANLVLNGPKGEAVALTAPAPMARGGFSRADGTLFADRSRVMLDDLRGASAFVSGRERLYLNGSAGRGSKIDFADELSLWSASEDITRLLSASSGLDDVVTLELGRVNGTTLRVGRYAASLSVEDGFVSVTDEAVVDDVEAVRNLEWFSIVRPKSQVIARHSWTERLSRRGETLPTDLEGPGLVLLRQDGRVVGRPTLAIGRARLPVDDLSPLQLAGLVANQQKRIEAIQDALGHLSDQTESAAQDRAYLLDLIAALDGIPPSALDVLKQLSSTPTALATLMATAVDDDQRAAVWRLDRELPFVWALIPVGAWGDAFTSHARRVAQLIAERGVARDAATSIAEGAVARAAEHISDLDPILRMPLSLSGRAAPPPTTPSRLIDSAQDRIRRTADLVDDRNPRRNTEPVDPATVSIFRRANSEVSPHLPDFSRFDPSQWEGLDAACAGAISATGKGQLTPSEILRIRSARAEEPLSFADMYAEALRLLARNAPLSC